jgi:hypothetical protein
VLAADSLLTFGQQIEGGQAGAKGGDLPFRHMRSHSPRDKGSETFKVTYT